MIYTGLICQPTKGNLFPDYFDWADHIATRSNSQTDQSNHYFYHLNKTAAEVERLAAVFKPHIPADDFNSWEKEWRKPSLAAAWIHDIGMIETRENHGLASAEMLFNADPRFDFKKINLEDKIKTGLLCVKHHTGWPGIFDVFKKILEKHRVNAGVDILKKFFKSSGAPDWRLDFSGKLISTADFLRHRGKNLRNDLKQPFFIWSECAGRRAVYDSQRDFCSTTHCGLKPEPKIVLRHHFKHGPFDAEIHPEFSVYNESDSKKASATGLGSHGYVSARDNAQLFARGDMSLFDVALMATTTWLESLEKKGIDCAAIISYIRDEENKMTDQYKTVVRVSLDISNIDAAIFAFQTYITDFMRENIATEDDMENFIFSNRSIIHIRLSDESRFSSCFKKISGAQGSPEHAEKAVKKMTHTFQEWKEKHDIVLPVEISKKRLEVISL